MLDFFDVRSKFEKDSLVIYPVFKVRKSKDVLIRGGKFYAIFDEKTGFWSQDEYDAQRLIDSELYEYRDKQGIGLNTSVSSLENFNTGKWVQFQNFIKTQPDSGKQLDEKITYKNSVCKRSDYVSRTVSYSLDTSEPTAYKALTSVIYDAEELMKIEWAIGSILAGDSKNIQKFIVLHGESGAGKSTILNIIQDLFEGYYTTFEAKALGAHNNSFALESFRSNPLVAIQHDGDLSRIEDNTKLNSLVSHEYMSINEKHKATYTTRLNAFLFMGTNKPVKITDGKSGLIRRLIDVKPSGKRVSAKKYVEYTTQIKFELGAIANHCLQVYKKLGRHYYDEYVPLDMMYQTDTFFNYVEVMQPIFEKDDYTTLTTAYKAYKQYCEESLIEGQQRLARHKFREELKNYFSEYKDREKKEGKYIRNVYCGFKKEKFNTFVPKDSAKEDSWLELLDQESIFDIQCGLCKAQYASKEETPITKWDNVTTELKDLDTRKLHYVRPNVNHIVVDFDLKNSEGEKDLSINISAASKFPPTYAEISKGGQGLHLHYIYKGDIESLSYIYADGIEIKKFLGYSSLRRKKIKCNNLDILEISSGLPIRKAAMIQESVLKNEQHLRFLIERSLQKEIHPNTKSNIDFIEKLLSDASDKGLVFDVRDMRNRIIKFAMNSTNQSELCMKKVSGMIFTSENESDLVVEDAYEESSLVFFDVEVFPNLFVVVWKAEGKDCVKMINPSPEDISALAKRRLIGFNNRRYDNHILYARMLGYTNEQLYTLSHRIINNSTNASFMEAYNLSYADVWEFSSVKQSLKKFEVQLALPHKELDLSFDEPVSEDLWHVVADYCVNDVLATESVFLDRHEDWAARCILSEISGLPKNQTTQNHLARILFGKNKKPQSEFVYTDLTELFPGYTFDGYKSLYLGEEVGEGGYVYSEPGMYENVLVLDIASMHPTTIIELDYFGEYTSRFKDILEARLAVKRKEFDKLEHMLEGVLVPYVSNPKNTEALAYALKIILNITYGMTAAKFDNIFRLPKNVDNIVAKRGALFMVELKHQLQQRGVKVIHIKTDSIKLENPSEEIVDFVVSFGAKYGYTFEREALYSKMCLVNDAVYIAKENTHWSATGAQFKQPYVFKKLFSKEPIEFEDMCVVHEVKTKMYLNMNEECDEDVYHFIGRTGSFCPIKAGFGGGTLVRKKSPKQVKENTKLYDSVSGTKGFRWLESDHVDNIDMIDLNYFTKLTDEAQTTIEKFGDFTLFTEE